MVLNGIGMSEIQLELDLYTFFKKLTILENKFLRCNSYTSNNENIC
jgi:hypothetical protein